MSNQTAQIIRAVIITAFILGSIAFQFFTWKALMVHQQVINSQGTVLKFLLEVPEIQAVVRQEILKREGNPQPAPQNEATKTQK